MWLAVLVGSGGCYLLKLAGLSVPRGVLANRRVQRIADTLPIALLATLVAVQTLTTGTRIGLDARGGGLAVALVAVLLRAPFLVVVAAAVLATALLRLVSLSELRGPVLTNHDIASIMLRHDGAHTSAAERRSRTTRSPTRSAGLSAPRTHPSGTPAAIKDTAGAAATGGPLGGTDQPRRRAVPGSQGRPPAARPGADHRGVGRRPVGDRHLLAGRAASSASARSGWPSSPSP